jgi:arylsulfatase A-like enzyme
VSHRPTESRVRIALTPDSYNGKWLPSWLQEAGYQTYYTGKLMNGNNVMNAVTRPTRGFNGMSVIRAQQHR